MSNSICKFMPSKNYSGNIKTINFVYEHDLKKLSQPFIKPIFVVNLVVKGNGILKLNSQEYELSHGCVFFSFPGTPYELDGGDDFKFIYISFMGSCVQQMLNDLEISISKPVYYDLECICDMWIESIRRINQLNANILTESVLLYTLSYINIDNTDNILKKNNENLFETLVDYVDNHYTEADISLKKIADIFSYTEKYLSYLFKKNMQIGFSKYINNLRIQHAYRLIENGETSVYKISELSGFTDSLYFSKVYKKRMGVTPAVEIKRITNETII